jgi:hypothetical protein
MTRRRRQNMGSWVAPYEPPPTRPAYDGYRFTDATLEWLDRAPHHGPPLYAPGRGAAPDGIAGTLGATRRPPATEWGDGHHLPIAIDDTLPVEVPRRKAKAARARKTPSVCRVCGAAIPATGSAGRPRVFCDPCRHKITGKGY